MLATEELKNSNLFEELFLEENQNMIDQLDPDKPLFDQVRDLHLQYVQVHAPKPKGNYKYSCSCSNVWGKPGLSLSCNLCGEEFKAVN